MQMNYSSVKEFRCWFFHSTNESKSTFLFIKLIFTGNRLRNSTWSIRGPSSCPWYSFSEHSPHAPKISKSEFLLFKKLLNLDVHEEVLSFILFPLKYPQIPWNFLLGQLLQERIENSSFRNCCWKWRSFGKVSKKEVPSSIEFFMEDKICWILEE